MMMTATDQAAVPRRSGTLSPLSAVLIVIYGTSLLLIGLGGLVLTYHEVNYAEPAREMLRSRHWLMTTFLSQPFVEKPPLINWSIAAAIAAFHGHSEWAVRLPSVLCGVLSALIIAALAARWLGDRIGLYSGLIQLTSVYVQAQGRRAEPDMMLCAAVSAAVAVFAFANVESRERQSPMGLRPWMFYLAAAISFLPKGPIGPVLVFLPCAAFALRRRRTLAFLLDPLGIALFIFLVVIWPLAVYWAYPPAIASLWREHTVRLSGAWGTQSRLLYLYSTLLLTLPWTPLLIIGGAALWRNRAWAAPIWRLLGLWFTLGAIFLSLSPFKHWHYLVPVLPPLSILAAFGLDRFLRVDRAHYGTRAALIAIATILAPLAIYRLVPRAAGAISMLILIAALGASVALYCQWRGAGRLAAVSLFITVWIVSVTAHIWVTPRFQTYLEQTRFAYRVNAEVPAGSTLYLLGPRHNQMVYYITTPVVPAGDPDALARMLKADTHISTVFVLAPQWTGAALARLGELEAVDRCKSLRTGESESDRMTLMQLSLRTK
jgi:4-amino-4-deoxy-L-arabinose transferase-like glycosyltransferase